MGRRRVEVEVVLLHILAVISFGVGQSEQPFLENRIVVVPQREREAKVDAVVRESRDAVLAPAIYPGAGLIVTEGVPSVAVGALVFPHRSPLALAEIRTPLPPADSVACLPKPVMFPLSGHTYGSLHVGM